MIKPADVAGGIVVVLNDEYQLEVHCQLNTENFSKAPPHTAVFIFKTKLIINLLRTS